MLISINHFSVVYDGGHGYARDGLGSVNGEQQKQLKFGLLNT
ncbi:hypothetical protein VCRA2120O333_50061 [Vibrio crassostreae]|nr:hypothetical protein VCRA2113O326_50061 [Vibrio crassostreae]CAK2152078.1 hypothetical protein VCRA2113O322_50183 [Vibrio crassostreae]CAK2179829.1 hypothetical protein VCRA2111O320_50061 [Vibrio crassostreae]CAK2200494.1 hypothetical protein VCRA2113O324_60172 [Vibrio crassostreae]CAK2927728.1 hypothetical protein VCRA2113O321_50061 [Vibrio crassostreae]